ncbi:tRNA (5-methylaminomethyl-2-thiouridine)(34)-methyltransferase MnmD [Kiloniella sp.]|uniref:tRNA (5-methylaminomethyl-2-thiouridine)(34)-methyltransferase MnmD n=1 Tax=Kiloniella sp. TaxID=1938587 RepID=UPI003B01D3BA
MNELKEPRLEWRDEHTPVSQTFDDVYFSPRDGLAESRYVFIEGIGGPSAWKNKQHFTIGETGFGTGLNFLATWQEWKKQAKPGQRLTYVSIEAFPLSKDQIKQSLLQWAELRNVNDRFLELYPKATPGKHVLEYGNENVTLILLFGDVTEMLSKYLELVDAWFLDGFSPRKNPEMWNEKVYQQLARLSKTGTKLATFTAAGHVRRGLERVGFLMDKRKGFAYKKEHLVGEFAVKKD